MSSADKEEKLKNMKSRIKYIVAAWVVNLIVFTSVLWIGHYGMHHGVEWIKTPCEVTLFSTGVVKIVLSILVLNALFSKVDDKV